MKVFDRNLDRLYRAIWKDDVIAYYTEHDQDYDRVLDIFVRANEGGTKLQKSDLLLSMVTSKWRGVNAREEIYGFVDRLNTDLARKNDFDKDFVMKSCLVLPGLPVRYKVQHFNNKNLALIESRWDDIKSAIEKAVDLANTYGIDRDTLTSVNALIPLAYYFFRHPSVDLAGSSKFAAKNQRAIRLWLTTALLNNVFGGSSDSLLTNVRTALHDNAKSPDFPLAQVNTEIEKAGRMPYFDRASLESFLDIEYGSKADFLALTLIYDDNNWGTKAWHKDHIFPQALFRPRVLAKAGIVGDQADRYRTIMNRIGNLELLLAHENQSKQDQPFENWVASRGPEFLARHLIPPDRELWRIERFEEFVKAREGLIKDRLQALFGAGA